MNRLFTRVAALSIFFVAAAGLLSCDDDEDSDDVVISAPYLLVECAQNIPTNFNGRTIKNTIVDYDGRLEGVWTEYFTWTSEGAGTYGIWHSTSQSRAQTKVQTMEIGGVNYTVPETFTYDKDSGVVLMETGNANDPTAEKIESKTYLLNTGYNYLVGADRLEKEIDENQTDEEKESVIGRWILNEGLASIKIGLDSSGLITTGGRSQAITFKTNGEKGVLLVNGLEDTPAGKLLFMKTGGGRYLFWRVSEASGAALPARSLGGECDIEFFSPGLIFFNPGVVRE